MKEKILVINDDDGIREMASLILQDKGYEICDANNGPKGIEKAFSSKPDLILLDIMMPGMTGYEVCQSLKASQETRDIPVIFFSSLTNPKDKVKGLELGGVDFINNVVDHAELLARVQTHLHIQSLTRSLITSNEELRRKQKSLDDDLQAAAMIQRSYLPQPNLKFPNLNLASVWLPANPLGGDIFNAIPCGSDKVIFYMIDVCGHDVPSALVTVSVSQYFHEKKELSPQKTMHHLDKEYPLERFNRYFTIFYLVLDLSSGLLSYSGAGHPAAVILLRKGGLKILESGGTIIGLDNALSFEEETEQLSPGDKVVLYTDGVTELKNRSGEFYGTKRLYDLLKEKQQTSVEEIVQSIQTSLNDFNEGTSLQDDTSILCFEFLPKET